MMAALQKRFLSRDLPVGEPLLRNDYIAVVERERRRGLNDFKQSEIFCGLAAFPMIPRLKCHFESPIGGEKSYWLNEVLRPAKLQ